MAEPLYGFPRKLAKPLREIANERLNRPSESNTVLYNKPTTSNIKAYIIQPIGVISGLTKTSSSIKVGVGTAYILERVTETSSGGFEQHQLIYRRDDEGEKVIIDIYNLKMCQISGDAQDIEINPSGVCFLAIVIQDISGDIYIVDTQEINCNDGSGSGEICIDCIQGVTLTELPIKSPLEMSYLLGVSSDGCLCIADIGDCTGSA